MAATLLLLPDSDFGPYGALNLREIWLMVTLIVGIGTVGYFVYKRTGKKTGMVASGILGGIISSTATAISYSRLAAKNKSFSKTAAFVIFVSLTVSILRVLAEIAIIVPEKFGEVFLPFVVLFIFMTGISLGLFYKINKEPDPGLFPEPGNPAQFRGAFLFGLLYAGILLGVAMARSRFGDAGLYLVAVLGGLAKKDAITLSLAHSVKEGLPVDLGWKLIMTGTLANNAFKIVLVSIMGSKELIRWFAAVTSVSVLGGLLLLWFC